MPTLCYLEDVQTIGACRVCLVEVEGATTLVASCASRPPTAWSCKTNSRQGARDGRQTVVELLLSEHDGDCQIVRPQRRLRAAQPGPGPRHQRAHATRARRRPAVIDDSTPALVRDTGKCIMCRRCVTVCNETQGVGGLFPQGRGFATVIGPAFASNLSDVVCVQCGQCAAVCPVGAITEKSGIDQVWAALDDPDQARGRPDGAGHPRRPRRGVRLRARHAGDRQDGRAPCAGSASTPSSTPTSPPTSPSWRRAPSCSPGSRPPWSTSETWPCRMFTSCSPGWINYMEHFNPDMLANLSTLQEPAADVRRAGQDLLRREARQGARRTWSSSRSCRARPRSSSASAPEMTDSGVQRRGHGAHHARAGAHDQAGRHRLPRPARRPAWTRRWASAPAPPTSSPSPAASWRRPCARPTRS